MRVKNQHNVPGKKTIARALAEMIRDQGVNVTFTLPGSSCLQLNQALHDCGIQLVLCKTEDAAVHAAHGYAAATGNAGCCVVSRGPGATNTVTGLVTASEGFPILLMVGDNTTRVRQKQIATQDVPLEHVFQTVAPCAVMEKDEDLKRVQNVFLESLAKRKSAVAVIASDIFGVIAPILPPVTPRREHRNIEMDGKLTQWLNTIIPTSHKPLILIGRGVATLPNLRSAMYAFVKEYPHIPCVISLQGLRFPLKDLKGIVGIMGEGRANRLIYDCDHLIILDERLGVECTGDVQVFLANKRVSSIEVSSEPQNVFTPHYTFRISEHTFVQFVRRLGVRLHATLGGTAWTQEASVPRRPAGFPETCLRELFARCDTGEKAVCLDSGQNFFWTARSLVDTERLSPIYSYHQATMGFALPAAVGASCAKKGEVLAVCGDGGFLMHCAELETIAHYNLPVKIVVLDNQGLGMVRQTQFVKHMSPLSVDIHVERFEYLARAFGLPFFEIRDGGESRKTIERFLSTPNAALLQIHIDPALQLESRGSASSPLPL